MYNPPFCLFASGFFLFEKGMPKKGKGHVEEIINSTNFGIKIFAIFKPS
jgi:hypothetical protein